MSDHPHPLPPDEQRAVEEALQKFRRQAKPEDFSVPKDMYKLIEQAFSHYPLTTLEGEPYVGHVVFVDPKEPREHLMFKGVHLFPR